MTIYVCQELEQNRAPLQQKRDSGDSSLCGELCGAAQGWLLGGQVTGRPSTNTSSLAEDISTDPPPFVQDEFWSTFSWD